MKLVFEHYKSEEWVYSCTNTIPFEYESKEKFIFDVLEKSKNVEGQYEHIILFNDHIDVDTIEQIEHNVYTLEEWFEKLKVEAKFEN